MRKRFLIQEGKYGTKKSTKRDDRAELNSMLKSSINFKSLGGMRCEELNLTEEDMQWWRDAKIGMFVHWGLYSILGRGEWVRHNEQIPWKRYTALADQFCPEAFDMHEWTDLAKEFGAKYMVMVTRIMMDLHCGTVREAIRISPAGIRRHTVIL